MARLCASVRYDYYMKGYSEHNELTDRRCNLSRQSNQLVYVPPSKKLLQPLPENLKRVSCTIKQSMRWHQASLKDMPKTLVEVNLGLNLTLPRLSALLALFPPILQVISTQEFIMNDLSLAARLPRDLRRWNGLVIESSVNDSLSALPPSMDTLFIDAGQDNSVQHVATNIPLRTLSPNVTSLSYRGPMNEKNAIEAIFPSSLRSLRLTTPAQPVHPFFPSNLTTLSYTGPL